MVTAAAARARLATGPGSSFSADAMPMLTKANSPPGPSSAPVSTDVRQLARKKLARATKIASFSAIRPATAPSSRPGSCKNSRKSIFMPTVKKNTPSNKPLNGSMAASMALP